MKALRGNGKLALAVAAVALVGAGAAWQAVPASRAPAHEPVVTGITIPVPAGPSGEPDFWNYDPYSGAKTSDASPGIAPGELARIWGSAG
jgi:hypothetical protein